MEGDGEEGEEGVEDVKRGVSVKGEGKGGVEEGEGGERRGCGRRCMWRTVLCSIC